MSKVYRSDLSVVDLLQCFFRECERRFRFLEQDYGYSYISGLAAYKGQYKIISPYHNQDIQSPFLAMTRYERNGQALEILFEEEHFTLEGHVYYDPVRRFELSEVLAAAKKHDVPAISGAGVITVEQIEGIVSVMADILKSHIEYYVDVDEGVLERAEVIRGKRMEHVVRKHFQNQIIDSCKNAAKAFLQKDYFEVISLLQPLEIYLAASDLKKLKLARKYLQA